VTDTATTLKIGVCGNHACSSAAETMFFQADATSDTAACGLHWQQRKCLTPCRLQSGSQLTQSPDSNIQVCFLTYWHLTTTAFKINNAAYYCCYETGMKKYLMQSVINSSKNF